MTDKIETPNYHHLADEDYVNVYEPAEDSFLMLDALEQELTSLRLHQPTLCIEIGPGSGIISAAIGSVLSSQCFILAFDINTDACRASYKTMSVNHVTNVDVVMNDCLNGLTQRLTGKVDLLVCNPPYVATDSNEEGCRDIRAAWAGGALGRTLIDRILSVLPSVLTDDGSALIVLEQCNHPDEVMRSAKVDHGLDSEVLLARRAGREFLSVVKFKKQILN